MSKHTVEHTNDLRQRYISKASYGRLQPGFTLLELLIVISVAAIMLATTAPSFSSFMTRSQVENHIQRLMNTMNMARGEAVSRGVTVSVCNSSDQSSCLNSDDWSGGLIVFIDNGAGSPGNANNGTRDAGEEILFVLDKNQDVTLKVDDGSGTAVATLIFNYQGFMTGKTTLANEVTQALILACEPGNENKYARGLVMAATGRAIKTRDINDDGFHDARFDDGFGGNNTNNLSC